MHSEGPLLETLTRRLSECPPDFLLEPFAMEKGEIHVDAVVSDLIRDLGGKRLMVHELEIFGAGPSQKKQPAAVQVVKRLQDLKMGGASPQNNRIRLILVASWLLHDSWFVTEGTFAREAFVLLSKGLDLMATVVPAEKCVSDPERREELVRLCLAKLGLRPAGETGLQAQDRLTTLDSVERDRVMRKARAAEQRAHDIREAMKKKAAEEAAAKYNRE